jgi:uncharacterized protein
MAHDTQHGYFLWTELLARDPGAAIDYYTKLLGWTTQPFPGAEPPYTMWANAGTPFGGLMALPDDAQSPPCWLPYVGVLDVDAAVVRAEEEGASVQLPPTDIPGAGRFAVLADPWGAAFAVYRAAAPQPEPPGPGVGDFCWHELATGDIDRALEFYGALFGWSRGTRHDLGELGPYQLFERHGRMAGGIYRASAEMPPSWTSYVRVADLAATLEKAAAGGGATLVPPMEVPGGDTIAVCADPQGAVFALLQVGG